VSVVLGEWGAGEGDMQCRMGPRTLKEGKGASRSRPITIYVPVAPLKLSSGADCASDGTSHQLLYFL